jgi:hypothetical protein
MLTIWRRPFAIAKPLPEIPLALTDELSIPVELEPTYQAAAADAYLT